MSPGFPHHLTVLREAPQWVAIALRTKLRCPFELFCSLLSYDAPYLVTLHPWATLHTVKLYAAPYWATLHPTELHCILFLSSACAVPSELCCNPQICAGILLSYNTPYWATVHPVELWCSLMSYTLLSYAVHLCPGHSTELRCTILNHAVPTKLRCALLS